MVDYLTSREAATDPKRTLRPLEFPDSGEFLSDIQVERSSHFPLRTSIGQSKSSAMVDQCVNQGAEHHLECLEDALLY